MGVRVLITGGAGYIGTITIERLALNREIERIYVVDKFLFGREPIRNLISFLLSEIKTIGASSPLTLKDKLRIIRADICNIRIMQKLIKKCDVIVHYAALVGDPLSRLNENETEIVNYVSTAELALLSSIYKKRFIFASTCSVYGKAKDNIVNENSDVNPLSPYAESKYLAEKEILRIHKIDNKFEPVILRFATAYGLSYRMRFDLVANIMAADAFFEGRVYVYGGEQIRPLVHIRDIANLIEQLIFEEKDKISGEIFNVGSNDQNYTIKELGSMIANIIGAKLVIKPQITDKRSYKVSFDKIRKKLDFKPEWDIKRFIEEELLPEFKRGKFKDYKTNPKYNNVKMGILSSISSIFARNFAD